MSALTQRFGGTPRAPGLEAVLEIVVGLAAVSGGLTLALSPDGSATGLSRTLLEGTGFDSYRVPGLLLAFVVGGLNLFAAALNAQRSRFASLASLCAGASLMVFIVTEALILVPKHPLQVVFFALGAAIVLLAAPERRTER